MCVSSRHSMIPALRHSMPGACTRSVESPRFAIEILQLLMGYTISVVNKYYENIRFDIFNHKTYDKRNIL
jgi:hypothetical protein